MNSRQRRKLLRRFLNLIEDVELDETFYEELVSKLTIQVERGDGAAIELLNRIHRIHKTSKTRNKKMEAIGTVIKEFIVQVIAEYMTRMSKGS